MRANDLASTTFRSMGTDVELLAPAADVDRARDLVGRVFDDWDRRLSRFRADSELSLLNAAAGAPHAASKVLFDVVVAALHAARATGGLFDPTVGGRLVALGYDQTFDALPADRPGAPLPAWRVGMWGDITIDAASRSITLPRGVSIDLGGIAKGMAVDAALDAASWSGIQPIAVNAGGDLAVSGRLEGGWSIGLDDARQTVAIRGGALATSSVLRRRWHVGGVPRHHLVDPDSGLPSRSDLVSVSVAAPSCRAAEVAAKTALLMGSATAESWLAAHRLAGVLVLESGEVRNAGEARLAA